MTARDVAALWEALELRLIASLKRNLARHKNQEKAEGGVPEHWEMWQAAKLRDIARYRRENRGILEAAAPQLDAESRAILREQYAEGGSGGFFGTQPEKLDALLAEMGSTEARVEKACLRYMDDVYRKTIRGTALGLVTGSMTLQQATDAAVKDFLAQGINCIEYQNGRRVNIATYAEMALRTNATRAAIMGEAAQRERLGIDTVLVSQYGACSNTCLPWQGLVYIDDVWQPYTGPHTPGGTYGVSRNGGQYPLLSVAVRAGLFHPNCRHTITTWVEGVSKRPTPMDKAKCEAVAALEQKQRALERKVRAAKRLAEGLSDPAAVKRAKAEVRKAQAAVKAFTDAHGDVLRRDYRREQTHRSGVSSTEKDSLALQSNSDIIASTKTAGSEKKIEATVIGHLDSSLLNDSFGKLRTDEVIITDERAAHIKVRHPEDYELFRKHGVTAITSPDILIPDTRNTGTVFYIKRMPETNLNVIVRLALDSDNPEYKNSVMTFYRIRERNLQKLIEKHGILYKKE